MTEVNGPGDQSGEMMALLSIAFRWRRFLLINVLAAAVISAGVSLLLPKWYRSTASILPPRDAEMLNPLAAAGSMLKGLNLGGRKTGGGSLGPYNYLAILKSRSALDSVVRKFNLTAVYGVDTSIEEAVKELKENTAFEVQDEDYITLEVLDKDPDRAAAIANYFVEVLNSMSLQLGTREARNNREFIEKRLEMTRADLRKAEDASQEYQKQSKMVLIPEQGSSVSIGGVAELYGMKARKEIELAILRQSVGTDDPAISQLELELREIDRKLETFPEISVESLRLYRDVVIQQKILEILLPLYEQSRVDEQKDVPVLLILDRAVKSEKKATPQRSLIVLASASVTLLISLLLAFVFQRAAADPPPGAPGSAFRRWSTAVARAYRVSRSGQ